jgi:hypothetical protein
LIIVFQYDTDKWYWRRKSTVMKVKVPDLTLFAGAREQTVENNQTQGSRTTHKSTVPRDGEVGKSRCKPP